MRELAARVERNYALLESLIGLFKRRAGVENESVNSSLPLCNHVIQGVNIPASLGEFHSFRGFFDPRHNSAHAQTESDL